MISTHVAALHHGVVDKDGAASDIDKLEHPLAELDASLQP